MFSLELTKRWVPTDVEPDLGVNGVWKGGKVVIGSGWTTIGDIETDYKERSWQLVSWNEVDVKGDSWSMKDEYLDERCDELLPGANSVRIDVNGVFGLPTLLETSLSGSERACTFYCEVSDLVWGLFEARVNVFCSIQPNISSSLNN